MRRLHAATRVVGSRRNSCVQPETRRMFQERPASVKPTRTPLRFPELQLLANMRADPDAEHQQHHAERRADRDQRPAADRHGRRRGDLGQRGWIARPDCAEPADAAAARRSASARAPVRRQRAPRGRARDRVLQAAAQRLRPSRPRSRSGRRASWPSPWRSPPRARAEKRLPATRSLSGIGGSCTCARMMSIGFSASNGSLPVSSSYRIKPSE